MVVSAPEKELTYEQRLWALRASKVKVTQEKLRLLGPHDADDWGQILPPPNRRKVVTRMGPSDAMITDCLLKGFEVKSNHPSGGFFGPKACGENFRALLECHPTFIDPMSTLAGAYVVNFGSYRVPAWNPDFDYSHLHEEQEKYQIVDGIGGSQHFCQDLAFGLEMGWAGILDRIKQYQHINGPRAAEFYDGLEDVVLGIQSWIGRHAAAACEMAREEMHPQLRENLETMADLNERLVTDPPATFREACQWILWYDMAARMYNGSGSLGRLDVLLFPYYQRGMAEGILSDEEATFHIACLLLRDTAYLQLGGPDASGKDVTNPVSFLVLEAAHRLKIPANIGVSVGDEIDERLLRRGVEIQFEDKTGIPKFLGTDSVVEGLTKKTFPIELARERAYAGCHWFSLPGRQYSLQDIPKINLGPLFELALREIVSDPGSAPSVSNLWNRFEKHLQRAVQVMAEGLDFHLEHMHNVFPELVLDLLCPSCIERGLDASHGGVEFYNITVDGVALATVADSFAAIDQRVVEERRLTWDELMQHLGNDWAGPDGERTRLMMKSIPHFGSGGSRADAYAVRIAQLFASLVTETPTPGGVNMLPGLFSWARSADYGKNLGATPNGRRAGEAVSHGASPDPGFRKDGAATAMAVAVAAVQPGYGNTAPMQIDIDPGLSKDEGGMEKITSLIKTHFDLGGTMINMNVLDAARILEAHKDPSKHWDLIVRVTGFSAYSCNLSSEFRQLVVDRMIAEG